ncbi:HNH endonuclease [Bacillus altitudinis]|uniref:HNH endonuclease n=1 Tax=Bacillus altitudinis TaxID=293387 RepID=UPI000BC2CB74|nr:HNH endonuclease [Bacillus altitudinis]ATH70838.1 hypothetical protein CFN77_00930 [Bacillus altitudinis]
MNAKHLFRSKSPIRNCDRKYQNYRSFKSYLIKDFNNRCGYCDAYDGWSGGPRVYHIDHFAPKSKFPHLENEYENLVYACPFCNLAKGNDWLSDSENISFVADKGYLNPVLDDYNAYFFRDACGNIQTNTETVQARYMHKKLKLYLERHRIIWNLTKIWENKMKIQEALEKCKESEQYKELLMHYAELSIEFDEFLKYIIGDILEPEDAI